jgi:hypothetical protein
MGDKDKRNKEKSRKQKRKKQDQVAKLALEKEPAKASLKAI